MSKHNTSKGVTVMIVEKAVTVAVLIMVALILLMLRLLQSPVSAMLRVTNYIIFKPHFKT